MGKKRRPLVSIIIPVYNAQFYLRRCVESVLSQTWQLLQIILVDDGSTDASLKMCNEYAKKDRRVSVIHKENGGVSSARNAGLDAAKGEYVTFVDSDDVIASDLIEQLLIIYRQFGGGIPICAVTRKMEKVCLGICRKGIVYTPQEAMRELTLLEEQRPRFEGWSVGKLFHISSFEGIRFPEGVSIGEDLAIMYRLFDRAEKIIFVNVPKYFYNENPCSAVNKELSQKDLLGILLIWDGFRAYTEKKYPKLAKRLKDRAAIGAVNYYYQICCGSYEGRDIRSSLVRRIQEDMPSLLYGMYPFSYKWKAFLIASFPSVAKKIFLIHAGYIRPFKKRWHSMFKKEDMLMSGMDIIKRLLFGRQIELMNRLNTIEDKIEEQKWLIRTATEHHIRNRDIICEVSLAEHCNLNCYGCDHFAPLAEPEFADFEETKRDLTRLSELFSGHIREFYLGGGEPLLHPDIIKFMEMARNVLPNSEITIITNGILLPRQPEDFWVACREYNISLRPTKYPIKVPYDTMEEKARQYGVDYSYWGFTGESMKRSVRFPYDLKGRQKGSRSFTACLWANNSLTLEHGRLYTCPIAAKVRHFNKYFGTDMRISPEDSIDIYRAESLEEIHEYLMQPIPFCRYCMQFQMEKGLPWHRSIPWRLSERDIKEWTL